MMKHAGQAPNLTHQNAASICAMALKAMGLQAKRAVDFKDGYDFLVEEQVRIAVRYAIPTSDRQQVYRKRNGELSHYSYKRWTFNFHRHGKLDERYCDFFVCFLASANGNGKGNSDVTVFVIPWEAITGLTFCSSLREGSQRPYRGKYAVYQDAWDGIEKSVRGERPAAAAAMPRKSLRISADSRRRLRLITGDAPATPARAGAEAAEQPARAEEQAAKPSAAETKPQTSGAGDNGQAPGGDAPPPVRPTSQTPQHLRSFLRSLD